MWPRYVGPAILIVALISLFISKLKNPYVTMFDIASVFFLVSSWCALSTVFYEMVIEGRETSSVFQQVRTLFEVDPTGKARDILRCGNSVSKSDMEKKLTDTTSRNKKNLWEGPIGIFIYTAGGIAVACLALHIIKNVKDSKIFFRPVELVILLSVLASSVMPIALFYLIIDRFPVISKSDLGIRVLDDVKTVLSSGLIGLWNSDATLRDSIDKSPDASAVAINLKATLTDQMQEIKLMIPSLDVLSADIKTEIISAIDKIKKAVDDISESLSSAAKLPCDRSLENQPDKLNIQAAAKVLPALPVLAQQLQDLSGIALDTGRSDIDVLLQDTLAGFQPILSALNRFATSNHCNERERIRESLRLIQSSCKNGGVGRPAGHTRNYFMTNVNGVIIGTIGVIAVSFFVQKTILKALFWHAGSVCMTLLLLLFFLLLTMNFAKSGLYQSAVDFDDYNQFMYLVLSESSTVNAKSLLDMPPKPDRCPFSIS